MAPPTSARSRRRRNHGALPSGQESDDGEADREKDEQGDEAEAVATHQLQDDVVRLLHGNPALFIDDDGRNIDELRDARLLFDDEAESGADPRVLGRRVLLEVLSESDDVFVTSTTRLAQAARDDLPQARRHAVDERMRRQWIALENHPRERER